MTVVRRIGAEVKLADPTTRKPPTTFRIFQYGKIDTVKGTFLFDKKAAASVMDNWKDWGNRLTFDYEHKATKEDGKAGDGKSAGSCLLSLQADGLYATDVRWTPQASTELSDGEWLYFSPTFLSDEKTDRILDLINIALTNIPATKGMTPLVTASKTTRKPSMPTKKTKTSADATPKKKVALDAPAAAPVAGPATPAETAGETEQDGGTGMDAEADAKAKTGKLKAAKSRLAEAKLEMSLAQAEHDTICKAMSEDVDEDSNKEDESDDSDDDSDDDGSDDDSDDDSDDPNDDRTGGMDTDQLAADGAEGEEEADPSNELDEEDEMPASPAKPKKSPPPASTKKVDKLSAAEQAILAVTGETDLRRGVGKLYAMGVTQGEVTQITRNAAFDALAKKYAKPGSLTPKMEKLGRDLFKRMGAEAAETFLTGLSVVATTNGTKRLPQAAPGGEHGLTKVELDMCKAMGNSPEAFANQKAENTARVERQRRGEE